MPSHRLIADDGSASDRLASPTDLVLLEVAAERAAQDERWGEQNHPDGTGPAHDPIVGLLADRARGLTTSAAEQGSLTWRHILREEYAEAAAEADPAKLRAELVQVAAVAVAWIEALDRRPVAAVPSG